AAPSLTPASGSLDLPENTDVLYASGTVDLADDPTIGVLFDHAFSRIGIELNTIGAFGDITGTPSVSVTGLNLATGNIDLLSGEVTAGETSSPTLEYADFENVDPDYDDAKIAYVYTAAAEAQDLTVTVQNLVIAHADGGLARTYFESTPASFNTNITPELGKSHHVALNLVESALTTNYNGNTVEWGRSNLYYRGDNGGDRDYAFYANNEQTSRADGFFGFGGTVAGTFATSATEGDPCALVYPAGLWRQPSKADFNGLVRGDIELGELTNVLGPLGDAVDATGITGIVDLLTNLLGNAVATLVNTEAPNSTLDSESPYSYGQYAITAGAPTAGTNAFGDANNASNNLRFYYNGQISDVTVLSQLGNGGGLIGLGLNDLSVDLLDQTIIDLGVPLLDSYGDLTSLWTNQQGTDILGLAGAGSWAYLGNPGRGISYREVLGVPIPTGLNERFHMANNTGELLNGVEALGIDVLSTTLKNVRCVRN
ncbi:MAG: fimbrillin family protein, partial [Sphingobacterium sp.]